MSDNSEEDSRRNSGISNSSFDRFVLDEVMVARAMIKTVHSLSDKQRCRVLKLKEGIIHKTPRKTSLHAPNAVPNPQRSKRKEYDFGMEGWSQNVPPRDPPMLPFGITNKTPFYIGDTTKETSHLNGDIEADKDALKHGDVCSKPSMKDNAFQADHEQEDTNRFNGGDLNGCKDEDKCPERCYKKSLQVENLSDNSSVDESEESISGKKTPEQHVSISLPPLLQPSAFQQKQTLPGTKTESADGSQQANSVSLKQFHWSPSESHVTHKNGPETSLYCYPREINKRTSWKILLEDASKLDGYKKMYANNKKRTETEMFSKLDVWKPQEASYLQKRLKALSYGKLDPSRRHSIDNVESKDLVQPTVSPSPDHWNFSSRVSLAQRMHGSRKIMEKEFPLVHYDTKSNSMSNLSEWTKAQLKTSIRQKGYQQRALQYSQLQLNLPAQDKASRRKDTPPLQ